MGRPHVRLERERAGVALRRGRRVARRRLRIAEVEPYLGDVRVRRQGAPEAGDGVLRASEPAQRSGKRDQGFEIVRIAGKPRLQLGDCVLDSLL
jgi:hypothetical protein